MSLEKFKEMNTSEIPVGKLIAMIGRGHTVYLNHRLEPFNINASQLHSLFEIKKNEGINQEKIAERCNTDKGAVARSIKKLEDKELVLRKTDENNRRQNMIFLTKKGEEIVEESIKILDEWEEEVFEDLTKDEKEFIQNTLKEIVIKTILMNKEYKNSENI